MLSAALLTNFKKKDKDIQIIGITIKNGRGKN